MIQQSCLTELQDECVSQQTANLADCAKKMQQAASEADQMHKGYFCFQLKSQDVVSVSGPYRLECAVKTHTSGARVQFGDNMCSSSG